MALSVKELQIGDWVQWKPQKGGFVGIVGGDRAFTPQFEKVKPSHLNNSLNNYYPIPLTPEILEKNGFTYNKNLKRYEIRKPHIEVIIYQNADDGEIYGFYITYTDSSALKCREYEMTDLRTPFTHELQHALHLCGLTDLADNFKV